MKHLEKEMTSFVEQYKDMTMPKKYAHYDIYKIGYFDIEATNLDANFGFILSYSILVRDTQTGKTTLRTAVIKKADIDEAISKRETTFDKRILMQWLGDIEDLDMLVGHYFNGWNKFDMPFVRTRLAECGLHHLLPRHKAKRFADTWKMAHMLYKISSYRLDAIGDIFGLKGIKTRIDGDIWQLARFGDKRALKYIVDHNKKDVLLTYKIHKQLEAFMPIPSTYV